MTIQFRVLEEIAHGGFGRVERVQLADGTIAARKVFDPTPAVLQETERHKLLARFRREVSVHANLPPDVVLPVLHRDLETDPPSFILPFAPRTYSEKIREDRAASRVDPSAIADIFAGLEELHRLGFVHRDLKPSNILFHDGKWKLSDFGLVTPAPGELSGVTSTGSSWGTSIYKAPEQNANFHDVSHHADIYSFGCILHDFFDRTRVPFERLTVPGDLGPIIEKCTERNPRRRFRDVAALRNAVLGIIARQQLPQATSSAAAWSERLGRADTEPFSAEELEELTRFLRTASSDDQANVMMELDNAKLEAFHAVDELYWGELVSILCDWACGSFGFDYCDVVASRLEKAFELGETATKASACLSLAELGASHNRWYCMRILMRLAGKNLPSSVADRIRIELLSDGDAGNFLRCAEGISRSVDDYHPVIAATLKGEA